MLSIPTEFPHVGSEAFLDAKDVLTGRDIVEPVRILRNNGDGEVLVSLRSHRYPHEIASGNRTVPLASLRATEQPASTLPSGRKPKARRGARP